MTREEFLGLLERDGWLWADHTEKDTKGIAFKKNINGNESKYHISDEGIEHTTQEAMWKHLRSHDVYHVTRIVGYYSRIHNWNKSKVGELKDRQAGLYGVK